ncbi:MAG: hypothetical protein JWQ98_2371 [Chlorobi bacterium]|nr:hypothetical protein [Chlorobiota bacterium]
MPPPSMTTVGIIAGTLHVMCPSARGTFRAGEIDSMNNTFFIMRSRYENR